MGELSYWGTFQEMLEELSYWGNGFSHNVSDDFRSRKLLRLERGERWHGFSQNASDHFRSGKPLARGAERNVN